jgi:hypothetical protein
MTFFLLGGFFAVMAVLVLVGTWWAVGRYHAMIINLVAGILLLVIGVGMISYGFYLRRKPIA